MIVILDMLRCYGKYPDGMAPRTPPPGQRIGLTVSGVVQIILLIAALRDLRRRPASLVRGRKGVWAAASFVNFIGPIAYFAYGRRR